MYFVNRSAPAHVTRDSAVNPAPVKAMTAPEEPINVRSGVARINTGTGFERGPESEHATAATSSATCVTPNAKMRSVMWENYNQIVGMGV
jgi:hypothetical protein